MKGDDGVGGEGEESEARVNVGGLMYIDAEAYAPT